ncbi:hypothetical protein [Pseudomaricurvus sp. HS19]|uniref:hypothetical protein n=1 Tax=Pseudomaricurvus sp. HS19 TaxID=2692626 RepID=UPI00136B55AE|nr:hypothetical protein [Pseudomaricurvus sp. HS19]MYM64892.1 hypothetical protein [Pseudomaricurvus sp. HS19]
MNTSVVIQNRFCGPPDSGNGGYVCGLIGEALGGKATVRLFLPPPLGRPLTLDIQGADAQLLDGDKLVAKGQAEAVDVECPDIPSWAETLEASKAYVGFKQHPFPGCFVCGPQRLEGDGLRIFPGKLPGSEVVAGPWLPDGSLLGQNGSSNHIDRVFIWAALDCTSAFPMFPTREGKALVLGQMSVQVHNDVAVGEQCIALGWPLGQDGRKLHSASAIVKPDGSLAGTAKATWIEVDAHLFQ